VMGRRALFFSLETSFLLTLWYLEELEDLGDVLALFFFSGRGPGR